MFDHMFEKKIHGALKRTGDCSNLVVVHSILDRRQKLKRCHCQDVIC